MKEVLDIKWKTTSNTNCSPDVSAVQEPKPQIVFFTVKSHEHHCIWNVKLLVTPLFVKQIIQPGNNHGINIHLGADSTGEQWINLSPLALQKCVSEPVLAHGQFYSLEQISTKFKSEF